VLRRLRCPIAWGARFGRSLDHGYRRIDDLDAAQLADVIARVHHSGDAVVAAAHGPYEPLAIRPAYGRLSIR
jgi:hypothetical protein